jgi:diamine N-acetyltransferase
VLTVRRADPSDARQLSRIAEATFRATFCSVNTAEDMDLYCQKSFGEKVQESEIANPNMLTLLCEECEKLAGFAQLRWGAAPACVSAKAPGEIQRLYVADEWHGKGVAQGLMRACIEEMIRRGSDGIWLGVWEHNPRAIAFYKKWGFVAVGDQVFSLGRDSQRDIVMVKVLSGKMNGA